MGSETKDPAFIPHLNPEQAAGYLRLAQKPDKASILNPFYYFPAVKRLNSKQQRQFIDWTPLGISLQIQSKQNQRYKKCIYLGLVVL